jgi:hypothetical protein
MKDDKHKREGQTGSLAKKNPGKDPGKDPGKNPGKDPRQDPRQDRLKLALRENLKRRKSQARGRGDITTAPSNDDEVPLHGGSEKKSGG